MNSTDRNRNELKRLELSQLIERRERLFSASLACIAEFVFIYDREGRFLFANRSLLELWGVTLEEAVGKNYFDLGYPAELGARLQRQVQEVFETNASVTDEAYYISPTGMQGFYEYILSPAIDGAGEFVVGTARNVTARKQTEEALRQSTQRLHDLIEALVPSVFVGLLTPQGILLDVNQAPLIAAGLKADDVLGKPFEETHWWTYSPDAQRQVREAVARGVRGEPSRFDVRTRGAEDSFIDVDFSLQPLQDERGGVALLVASASVITERERAELLRRESEQRLAFALEAAEIGDWDIDLRTNVTRRSLSHDHCFGYREAVAEWGLEVFLAHVHPHDRAVIASGFQKAVAGEDAFDCEVRVVWPDGSIHWLWTKGHTYLNQLGKPYRMAGIVADITRRKQAEILLAESRQRLSLATASAHIGIWDLDVAANTLVWDAQMYELHGLHEDDFSGAYEAWQNGLHPGDRERSDAELRAAIDGDQDFHSEFRVLWPNGEVRDIEAHAVVRRTGNESTKHVIGVNWDITARKRDEQALHDRGHQQVLIANLGRSALANLDIGHVFVEAAAAIAEGLGVEYSKVMQLNADDGWFSLNAGVGWHPEWLGRRIAANDVDPRLARVIETGKPVIIDDFAAVSPASRSEILKAHGIVSAIDVAIGGGEGVCGVLGAYSCDAHRFNADSLDFLQSIANILATALDRSRREAKLMRLAQFDSLTDLPNKVLLKDRLAVALAHAQRSGRRLAVMFIDLDRFKNVNDSLGHELGDRLLQEVARRLSESVRASDTISRQGGDEFLAVLPEIDSEIDAARVAEKLLVVMAAPVIIDGVELLISGSVGVAWFPEHGTEADTLLRNADAAMYAAKDMGGNRYQFYSEEMNFRAHERLRLEADLRRAVERQELFLQFQPQFALGSGAVIGVEALVRWRHPTRGVVPPVQFIPMAEESGLIVAIGAWVLDAACRQQTQWVREGLALGPMAVNMSAQQFRQPAFVPTVIQTLERTRLAPHHLELELTESVVMHSIDVVREKLMRLDTLGVKLAIDDFGTGYSSLSYLTQFPIHRLKIDRSFISGLPEDKGSGAIAQAVISMGHSLGLNVLAEGIETRAQAEYLQSLLCDSAQGFLYSRPLSAGDCSALLASPARNRGQSAL